MTTPPFWTYGNVVLGCGTFGGIGGSVKLVGQGLDEAAAFATMDEAVALGITLFDTAESYAAGASERMMGRWMTERDPAVTGQVRLLTKVAPPRGDEAGRRFDGAFLEEKFSGSLERLGVDAVDLLLTHAPDDDTPIQVTLEGLEAIRASGRCRYLGACNVDAGQLTAALEAAEPPGDRWLSGDPERLQPAGSGRRASRAVNLPRQRPGLHGLLATGRRRADG